MCPVVFMIKSLFNVYFLILRESERGRERERERGRERIESRLLVVSAESNMGLDPMNCEILT